MGRVETFRLGIEPLTESPRTIYVYLPDSYDRTNKKYPVLYMFDGHNLFFDTTATYGKCWGLKKYLDKAQLDLIVIGQDCNHTGHNRLDEYCPYDSEVTSGLSHDWVKGLGSFTAEWFATVLKKECESRYRIYKDRKHVGIGGSSMGGLMAQYMIAKYNKVYSKAACVSSATYYCFEQMKNMIAETDFRPDTRIYTDFGSEEAGDDRMRMAQGIDLMLQLNHLYEIKGCRTYPHLVMNGTHSEASWETVVPLFLEYLYPELYD